VTLIVGIRCQDGIVLAADSAATFDAAGIHTIRQSVNKLEIISDCMVIGVSGAVGLGQQLRDQILDFYEAGALAELSNGTRDLTSSMVMTALRHHLWMNVIKTEMESAGATMNVYRQAANNAIAFTLLALPILGQPCLIQFMPSGAPEEATVDLPFVAIGSGQSIADPFLAFLRRVLWPDGLPTLEMGTLTAIWAVNHAIETNSGGVAAPIKAAVLTLNDEGQCGARHLNQDVVNQHLETISQAERHLSLFFTDIGEGTGLPSTVPSPDN
jgi:20S proteasome alpha/beta subunit